VGAEEILSAEKGWVVRRGREREREANNKQVRACVAEKVRVR
jgi:hypothetical protein